MNRAEMVRRLEEQIASAEGMTDEQQRNRVLVQTVVQTHKTLQRTNPSHPLLQYMALERFTMNGESHTSPKITVGPEFACGNAADSLKKYARLMTDAASGDLL